MKNQLISFHGKQELKDAKIADIKRHRLLDNMIQGDYFDTNKKKGCAVTCTMFTPEDYENGTVSTSNIHARYETQIGISRILAHLEDKIFEGLPVELAKEWPLKFIEAVPVGVDLDNVWRKLMIWLLVDANEGVIKYAKSADSRKAIQDVADTFTRSLETPVSSAEWAKVRNAADAAAYAYAADAAAAYADAAAYAAYADAAAYAAAADAAAAAAADAAAADAADADAADADADALRNAARERRWILTSEKLIELLREAK